MPVAARGPAARPHAGTRPRAWTSLAMPGTRMRHTCVALALLLLLTGCGADADRRAPAAGATTDALPSPQQAAGNSVTGMPDAPGPGDVPLAGAPPAPPVLLLPSDAEEMPPLQEANPETGLLPGGPASSALDPDAEPGIADAVAVIAAYYAALDAGDFDRAYALWSDGGSSSGQTPQQFARGFADTAGVAVQPGEPGRIEGAAGSRYLEVPVSVTTTGTDGNAQRSVGAYVLRRAVVDGASAEQRAWRIASAELRELQP